jgi:hypothetical protein
MCTVTKNTVSHPCDGKIREQHLFRYRNNGLTHLTVAGTSEEFLDFASDTLLKNAADGSLTSVGEDIFIHRNGSIFVHNLMYHSINGTLGSTELHCVIGDSMQFIGYEGELSI